MLLILDPSLRTSPSSPSSLSALNVSQTNHVQSFATISKDAMPHVSECRRADLQRIYVLRSHLQPRYHIGVRIFRRVNAISCLARRVGLCGYHWTRLTLAVSSFPILVKL